MASGTVANVTVLDRFVAIRYMELLKAGSVWTHGVDGVSAG